MRQSADRLMDQLRQGGDFERLAAQFSQSRSASNGGLIGWVRPDQLDQELADAVTNMKPGQYDGPIRSTGGYYIVQVRRTRPIGKADPDDTVVALKQIFVSAPRRRPRHRSTPPWPRCRHLRARISNCDDMDKVGGEVMPAGSIDLGSATIGDLPDELKDIGPQAANRPDQRTRAGRYRHRHFHGLQTPAGVGQDTEPGRGRPQPDRRACRRSGARAICAICAAPRSSISATRPFEPPATALPPLREVIARHGLGARHSLGQHFLLDLNLTGRIARAAGDLSRGTTIEIGPGPGRADACAAGPGCGAPHRHRA